MLRGDRIKGDRLREGKKLSAGEFDTARARRDENRVYTRQFQLNGVYSIRVRVRVTLGYNTLLALVCTQGPFILLVALRHDRTHSKRISAVASHTLLHN